jgi:hypothetical protein
MLGAMSAAPATTRRQDQPPVQPVDLLNEVDGLLKDGRNANAVERILHRLPAATDDPALLDRLAIAERRLDREDVALSARELAARYVGVDLDTTVAFARALVDRRRYLKALALLHELPPELREDQQARDAQAGVYERMALHGLAYDAYGPARRLRPWQRRDWLRLWWRTGGPMVFARRRQRRHDEAALRDWPADPPITAPPADLDALTAQVQSALDEERRLRPLLDQADQLMADGDFGAAADALGPGLSTDPSSIALLLRLAWAERLADRDRAALARLAEVRGLDPANLEAVEAQIRLLTDRRRFREALAVLDELPEVDRRHPDVRAARAELYQAMGLPTLARNAYGDRHTLWKWQRRQRRRDWWRSGGPFRRLLWRPRRFEEEVLRGWRFRARHLRAMNRVSWPAGFDPTDIRNRIDAVLERWTLISSRWWSIHWWVRRVAQTAAVCGTALVLLDVARRVTRLALPAAIIWTIAATAAAFALYLLIFVRLIGPITWHRAPLPGVPAGLGLVGIGYLLTGATWPSRTLAEGVGVALVATAGVAAVTGAALFPVFLWWALSFWRLWRNNPREDILDEFLQLLDELDDRNALNGRLVTPIMKRCVELPCRGAATRRPPCRIRT